MSINAYLNFNGNCRDAVKFYEEVFGTEPPRIISYGDSPADSAFPVPEEARDLVMHTELIIQGSPVMFADVLPGMPFVLGDNISLLITANSQDEITLLFDKLKQGGIVHHKLQETFWSKCYGSLTDKFGIPWQFYQEG